jgi:hypothetical protein
MGPDKMNIEQEARQCADLVKAGDTTALGHRLFDDRANSSTDFRKLLNQIEVDNKKDDAVDNSLPIFSLVEKNVTAGHHQSTVLDACVTAPVAHNGTGKPDAGAHSRSDKILPGTTETVLTDVEKGVFDTAHTKSAYYIAEPHSEIIAHENPTVVAESGAVVDATDRAQVFAKAGSGVEARGHSWVIGEVGANIVAEGGTIVANGAHVVHPRNTKTKTT